MPTNRDVAKQEIQTAWERFLAERGLQVTGEVVLNSSSVELTDGTEGGSFLWFWYPAQVELLVQAYRKLLKAAGARNMDIGTVDYVRGARITGTDLVMIYPATEQDVDRIPMADNNNHKWANMRSLLEPVKRLAPKNRKVRYEVTYLEDSPVGPCIVFDQSKKLETRLINTKKAAAAAQQQPAPSPTPGPQADTAAAAQSEPNDKA